MKKLPSEKKQPILEVSGAESAHEEPEHLHEPGTTQHHKSQEMSQYQLLAENIKDLVWTMDMDLNYTYISPSVQHIRGYTPEEAMKLSLEESTTPESLRRLTETLQHELQADTHGRKSPSRSQIVEFEVICKDGSLIWMEGNMTFVRDESGKPVQIVGVAREITDRKRAEQTSKKWMQIFESARWGVAVLSPQKYLLELTNPAFSAMYGYSENDMTGLSLMDLFPFPEREKAARVMAKAADEGHRKFETRQTRSDGSDFPALIDITAVEDSSHHLSFYVIHTEDLSEQKRAEKTERAAARLEATATLAGGIAHDFNNLMMAVMGNASLARLELGDTDNDSVSRLLEEIERAAQKAGALTHQMLAYARGGKYQPRVLNLNDSINEILKIRIHALPKQTQIETDLEPDLACVLADPTQMGQIILNLSMNAIEAVEDGGSISIITRNETLDRPHSGTGSRSTPVPYVTLTLRDSGKGMDEATMSHVFEPYFSTKETGRGLGLAAVYGIVKHHDGYITASSQENEGAEFKVYLPAVKAETDITATPDVRTVTGTETVLVVDDDALVINATKGLLEHFGYRVLCASNGKEAVDLAASYKDDIQVAILDMGMPVMNGTEAFPLLMAAKPQLKIIIASGYELDAAAQRLLDSGAHAFLHKPFHSDDLGYEIRKVLASAD